MREQIEHVIGLDAADALAISAKTGAGVAEVLEAIVERIPPPRGDPKAHRCGRWCSTPSYDAYRGVRCLVRVVDGSLAVGQTIRFMDGHGPRDAGRGARHLHPPRGAGRTAWARRGGLPLRRRQGAAPVRVGDTVTDSRAAGGGAAAGFREAKPMVFAGLYPVDASAFGELREALEKLSLNDSAFTFQPETSQALGFGFRCGFLGLLHMEIVQERLEREFDLELITTAPGGRLPGADHRRRGGRGGEPGAAARPRPHRGDRGAAHPRHDPHPGRATSAACSSWSRTAAASS